MLKLYLMYETGFNQIFLPKMNGIGDSNFQSDYKNKHGSFGDIYPREEIAIKPLISNKRSYKKNLLTNAAKISHVLERQSLIDCLEADEEYIISAGRDHNINVWNEGLSDGLFVHLRRLSGHHAPVTGLYLYTSGHLANEKIVVSSSEDGSIKIWSLNQGKEINKIETGNVITCMGVMDKSLVVIGNHKGYIEVYHLRSGDLYVSIRAHQDPVEALEVYGSYVCTATFEEPSCLKVWYIQFEQTRCIYRVENSQEMEFCCLAVWNTNVILGASNQAKLFVIDFENDLTESIILDKRCEKIESIKVQNEWIISCFTHKNEVFIDVRRFHNYEHFGTFLSGVQQVKAIAAIELDNSFKIVVGGSSLVLQSFNFNLTNEETDFSYTRFPVKLEKPYIKHKEKSNYTMKCAILDDFHDEDSFDSDDSDFEKLSETFSNCDEKLDCALKSNFYDADLKQDNDESPLTLQAKMERESSIDSESGVSTQQSNFNDAHFKQDNDESLLTLQRSVEKESSTYNGNKVFTPNSNFDDHFKQDNSASPLTLQRKIEREYSINSECRISTPQSNSDVNYQVNTQNENVKSKSTSSPRQKQMLSASTIENVKNKPTSSPRQTQILSVLTVVKTEASTYPDIRISPSLDMAEPRVAMRKLEKELDNKHEKLENFIKNNKNVEENEDAAIVNHTKLEEHTQKDDVVESIKLDDDENHTEETKVEDVEHSKLNNYIKKAAEDLITDEDHVKKENYENLLDIEKSFKKNKKCKKSKKKESRKSKRKRCEIM